MTGPAAILIGPPGAGKSTVGRLVAERLGVPFLDTDDRVEAMAGKPVGDIFIEDGEQAFRALEREAVAWAVAEGSRLVIGLGGGAVLDPATQRLLAGRPVVYLATGFAAAARRVGMDTPRPLLIGNPRARLRELLARRLPIYEKLAWITVPTDDRTPDEIAGDVAARLNGPRPGPGPVSLTRIGVGGERPYEVVVGAGAVGELPSLAGPEGATVVVIHPAGLGPIARPACQALRDAGYVVHAEEVPGGEAAKDIAVAARLWSRLAAHRVGRRDAIVGLGGGATTDLAGFTAATWLRGVRLVLVPTTLLAVVDAAVGGKTAINIAEGKNLVGSFHPPAGVLADPALLASLPPGEYASGLAEVIKAGFIADPVILDLVEADPEGSARAGGPHERELIERAVRVKAAVVSADLREAGPREMLNYGHTLGHAIERAEDYRIRHGAAVAIGMVYAAAVARLAGRLDEPTQKRHQAILAAVGLPTGYRAGAWPRLREAMAVDKKTRASALRMVVLDELARPGILTNPPEALLEQAYAEIAGGMGRRAGGGG